MSINQSQQQIAREAAQRICKSTPSPEILEDYLTGIILSAIERAKDEWNEADYIAREMPQPQRSEQQEWMTRGTVQDSAGTCHIRITPKERDAIIATLADERKKYQSLLTVHEVFCTAIRKAIGMESPMPISDILDHVTSLAARHRESFKELAADHDDINDAT
jgi:hypothetical protein